jgi:hypothetical protein
MKHHNWEWKDLVVSPLEFARSLKLLDEDAIKIYDTTPRDGEQMPGVALHSANACPGR